MYVINNLGVVVAYQDTMDRNVTCCVLINVKTKYVIRILGIVWIVWKGTMDRSVIKNVLISAQTVQKTLVALLALLVTMAVSVT